MLNETLQVHSSKISIVCCNGPKSIINQILTKAWCMEWIRISLSVSLNIFDLWLMDETNMEKVHEKWS